MQRSKQMPAKASKRIGSTDSGSHTHVSPQLPYQRNIEVTVQMRYAWIKVSVDAGHGGCRLSKVQQKDTTGTTNQYRLDFVRTPSSDCGGFAWCKWSINAQSPGRKRHWPPLAPSLWQSTSPFWRRARRKFDLGVKWVTSCHVHSPGHEKASARHIVSKWKNVLRSCSLNTSPTIIEFRAFQAAHACHASSCVSSHIINDFPTKPAPGRGHRVLHLLKKMHPCKGWVIKEASFL